MSNPYQNSAGSLLGGSASVGQEACARMSHVDGELSQLENTADRMQAMFDELVGRLQPVLHFVPEETRKEPAPENSIAPLASRIRKVRQRLESLENSIGSIYRAVEL